MNLDPNSSDSTTEGSGAATAFSSLRDDAVWDDPEHLKGEIFTETLLLEHAQKLGRAHRSPTTRGSAMPLRRRFRATRTRIREAYAILAEGAERQRDPSPAELWLLDNGHIVEGQLREIEEDLPWGYLVKLPRMSRGKMRGYPLVYALCLDYLRHSDCHVDFALLARFVNAYQQERVLTIGELWAIPIMLRLGLVLAVSALASSEAQANDRDLANEWARRLLNKKPKLAEERLDEELARALAELERWKRPEPPTDAFLVTLLRKLREREDAPAEALDWVARQTARLHTSPEELARRYHLSQAADQVSVGNAITSMRSINRLDWSVFFRETSHVEAILRRDPREVYARMDDASRDRCRHTIEKIARFSKRSEVHVAEVALSLARKHLGSAEDYRAHVGYYLVDDGRRELYKSLSYKRRPHLHCKEISTEHPAPIYLGSIGIMTAALAALAWAALSGVDSPLWLRALLFPCMLFAACEIAVAIVNAAIVTLLPPRILPKFEFEEGIPEQFPTFVVVPTLLGSQEGLARLLEELEVRSLANTDEHLYFALLTDFPDADAEELSGDAELLDQARLGIERLNEGHDRPRFFLFHRKRSFDENERRFMGWERKRGKLHEFNRLLRGAKDTSFTIATAPESLLSRVRFVITLDTDTELPLGVARRLVAALAHPLNRPWVDPKRQRVIRGHALIQPRVGTSPMSARQSVFARLAAGPPGIDPYTTAVSDVYQDLFGEGSFVGKGIYDVDAFEAAMAGRVPENQLLSHDLFESIYARSALASDIEVLDEQPAAYSVAAGREHRWIRGDWQLSPWLLPRVPGNTGTRRSDFRAFDAWRVLDNMRRSLVAPALVILSLGTWLTGPSTAWVGGLLVISVFVVPVIGRLVFALARAKSELDWLGGLGGDFRSNSKQACLSLVFLLDRAIVSVDAIIRAIYRQLVSRRNMLEWTSMRDASNEGAESVLRVPRLLVASGLSALFSLAVLLFAPSALPIALPLLVGWALSPWIAVWISRTTPRVSVESWGEHEVLVFRRIARKTWRFFERFVGDLDHHLPPDNFQEDPRGVVAHRTSPTNIGLYLLSVAAARDLGFIPLEEALRRWSRTLGTLDRLEKREGHILNWYDTKTLQPLEPRYVSTVDSGNLAGYLWTLAEVCRDAREAPLLSERIFLATLDALYLARESLSSKDQSPSALRDVTGLIELFERSEAGRQGDPKLLPKLLVESFALAEPILVQSAQEAGQEFSYWMNAAQQTLSRALSTLREHLGHQHFLESWIRTRGPDVTQSEDWHRLEQLLHDTANLSGLTSGIDDLRALARRVLPKFSSPTQCAEFEQHLALAHAKAEETRILLDALGERAERLVDAMNFAFLYDPERHLFSIGYNVSGVRLDNSHYDLLASEARLASLVAIAKGDVPVKHWFRLGRLRANYASTPGLLSWSGSMFEYLMPLLVTRSYPDTLLDQTCHAVIEKQIDHAKSYKVPWGVSEAAYNVMDLSMNYQYRAFGVPGLGLKPGLGEDLVVAPYATALAVLVRAKAAAQNFEVMRRLGIEGPYGFYEAVDYTPSRLPPSKSHVVVKAFMAHHQGMTLVALSNLLTDFAMQRRFHTDARVKACGLLLEERIPFRAGVVQPETPRATSTLGRSLEQETTEHLDWSQVRAGELRGHLLGQGGLSSWITAGGEGFLTWHGIDVPRFREESSLPAGGISIYLQNLNQNDYWSSGYMPSRAEPSHYDAVFSVDKVEIGRRDGDIETLTEITLSPEHPAEIRRVILTNHAHHPVRMRVTSFTELSLAPRGADIAHPAFQKMFVETERQRDGSVLIAHRRKRSAHDANVWLAQMFVSADPTSRAVSGTSRNAFLGRGGSIEEPAGLWQEDWAHESGALDPAFILRREVELPAGGQVRFALVTVLGDSREALLNQIDHYLDTHSVARAFEFAWAGARVELRHLGITSPKAHRYQRLLSAVFFPQPGLRGEGNPPVGTRGRDALWSQGISGDLPIVVLRLDEPEFSDICRDMLLAHEYWRQHGVSTDLVLLNEEPHSYLQPVQDAIFSLIRSTPAEGHVDQRGGVFVRRTALISEEDLQLILSAARAVLSVSKGSLSAQLRSIARPRARTAPREPRRHLSAVPSSARPRHLLDRTLAAGQSESFLPPDLLFANGIGGFDPATGEYTMQVDGSHRPPQPWSNVMAGPSFGALVTESGASYSWFENSQKHRITPWFNDPTLDPSGELFFARDTQTGEIWSLTPAPAGGEASYEVRHGQGYSSFTHTRRGLTCRLHVAVDPSDPIKVWHVSLENRSSEPRQLRVYAYAEWVLGNHREALRVSTITSHRPELRAILARNPFSPFPRSSAFLTSTAGIRSFSCDREEFFGRFGARMKPAALTRAGLSGRSGSGLDPCAAFEVELTIEPGAATNLAFVLGAGTDERHALELITRYHQFDEADAVLSRSRRYWDELLGRIQVRTPDPAFDLLTNRWLPYQVLSCRFWGRSAFFQSGGAYGFRDQLQDAMALLHMRPDLARAHILLAASRQFLEGDVQHWWHPDTGEGVRTHCSDDLLWLPWAASEYVKITGDESLWDENVGFLQERMLEPGRDDLYSVPPAAAESASLYEHCLRALKAGNTQGPNGLPLMRAGDWNDGMNRVGERGQGESVWLGWFLVHVLDQFTPVAERRGDRSLADWCRIEAKRIGQAIDQGAWDGAWYRRATFDDGRPIGSNQNSECKIDAIAQSWAIISRGGRPDRASLALDASLEHLWNRPEKMLLLLTPPFSGKEGDPGYIAAYPPGIRENGGQYSHGVLWTVLALLLEGRGADAYELLSALQPIRHATTPEEVAKYQVEPYVVAADVYSEEPHVGRGGWTWYTGSASWMYRIGIERLLGFQKRGSEFTIDPCVSPAWDQFEMDYRTETGGQLTIRFENPERVSHGVAELWLNGKQQTSRNISLPGAGERLELRVVMGAAESDSSRQPKTPPREPETFEESEPSRRMSGQREPR